LFSNLTDVGQNQFGRLVSLEELQLRANSIQLLQPGAFTGLRSLKYLNLANNHIKELQPGVFSGTAQ
jgi:Leucine-rich repeat (LRR) protein